MRLHGMGYTFCERVGDLTPGQVRFLMSIGERV